MANSISFTKGAIEALPLPPKGKRVFYQDFGGRAAVRGLSVRISSTGERVFYLYRWSEVEKRPLMIKLGRFPDMSIEQARKAAEQENASIATGAAPGIATRPKVEGKTFGELFAWYYETHALKRKRSHAKDMANFTNHLGPLHDMLAIRITKALVRQLHQEIGEGAGFYAANRVLALVGAVFSKAIAFEKHHGPNPAHGVEQFREFARKRRLSPDEVVRFRQAIDDEPSADIRDFVLLLLYTGVRRSNLLEMRWDQVDYSEKTWTIPTTKGGDSEEVPLEEAELVILQRRQAETDSPWVFPGRSDGKSGHMTKPEHGWQRILARVNAARAEADEPPMPNFRMHDLRRTLGSWMMKTGASLDVVGKTLHHQDTETTRIYARLHHDDVRTAKQRAHTALDKAGKKAGGA